MQKRAIRIIFHCFLYEEALVETSVVTLLDQRQALTYKLFKQILENKDCKRRNLLPSQKVKHYDLRKAY